MGDDATVTASPDGFLGRLTPDDAAALVGLGRVRRYPARAALFFEGDDAHEVLIITSGDVKVTMTSPDGREVVLDVLGPGELLGELSAIDGAPVRPGRRPSLRWSWSPSMWPVSTSLSMTTTASL